MQGVQVCCLVRELRSHMPHRKKKKKMHLEGQFWRRRWHPTPVLLPGKSHGRRSLVGCRPWGREESDRTERLHFHFSLSCIGEGNGNPLQCSCLENPRDGGAWWAAIYGIAQSRTRLKWLSSSSSSREGEERKASISERPSLYQESEDRIWLVNKISVCISGLHDSKQ